MHRFPELFGTEAVSHLRDDYQTALLAVRGRGSLLNFVSDELRLNVNIARASVQHGHFDDSGYPYLPTELQLDPELACEYMARSPSSWWRLHTDNPYYIEAACRGIYSHPRTFGYLPKLLQVRDMLLYVVSRDGSQLQHASAKFKKDRDVVYAAVMQEPMAFKYADKELRGDLELARLAVERDPRAARFVDHDLIARALINLLW